jgi:hypothetical protein
MEKELTEREQKLLSYLVELLNDYGILMYLCDLYDVEYNFDVDKAAKMCSNLRDEFGLDLWKIATKAFGCGNGTQN